MVIIEQLVNIRAVMGTVVNQGKNNSFDCAQEIIEIYF